MKIVTIKGLWLLHWCTKLHIDISSLLWVIGVWIAENWTHTHTHTHTSGCQLKIKFLDVLDYSEYSDTNISKTIFSRKHSFLNEEAKVKNVLKKRHGRIGTCGDLLIFGGAWNNQGLVIFERTVNTLKRTVTISKWTVISVRLIIPSPSIIARS